ncbi:MAG: MurR/RpiR family transcriptional regulator [Faecalibacterium sp.]|nr:MurR/RpiR family transcriptional regulator [Faecalibacterium sp.]
MQEMQDMIERLNQSGKRLSKGHRRIAQYIVDHYDKAVFMTASRLGESVGVSESTVVRFASALGWLTMGSLAGEGYTLASFSSWRNAQKAMDAAIQGDVQGMEKYFYYGGVFPNGPLSAQQMLQQLQAVEQTYGLTLEKAVSSVEAAQEEDGFMYCSVTLTVRHYGTRYQLVLKGHPFEQGRIGFMQPTLLWTLDQTTGELAVPEWLDSLQQALCTYNPG